MMIVMCDATTTLLHMFSISIIDDSRSIIDKSRVTFQLVASITIVIYDCHILTVQATRARFSFKKHSDLCFLG